MNEKFVLSIGKPCSEKFGNFKQTDTGGFCNSCQKTVVDFSTLSDRQISAYFEKNQKNICGNFNKSQLKTYSSNIVSVKKKSRISALGAGLMSFSLISLGSVHHSWGQHTDQVIVMPVSQKENLSEESKDSELTQGEYAIEGTIVDKENGDPLPGVNVMLKGSNIGCASDFDGKFAFPKLLKTGDTLIINYMGFETQKIVVSDNQKLTIVMEESHELLMGEVAVHEVYASKRTFWKKIKCIFR
ncbi:hypothetical protein GCM10022393_28790 [Aquimarina addita]|uniref:Carboxypeptidase-like protein n=1 Tax=Aquimarina addita TaxID=870485 RepID=A0ABP6UP05_9FLAO